MTFDEAASVFVLVMAAVLLGWRYRPRVFFGRLGATIEHLTRLFIMSPVGRDTPRASDMEAVSIPVSHTDMEAHTTPEARDITDDWEMPRISRTLNDQELITMLALQRKDGKYRSSANKIAEYVGGDRNTVLRQIREVREGPPAPQVREYQARLEQLAAAHDE
jgi:hypothetical protein